VKLRISFEVTVALIEEMYTIGVWIASLLLNVKRMVVPSVAASDPHNSANQHQHQQHQYQQQQILVNK
jgi:hypothetical protein